MVDRTVCTHMIHEEFHEILGEIEDVEDLSGLHVHLFKINDVLEDVPFSELVAEEEDHLKEWLEEFHDAMAAIAEDLNASSYNLTVSGGTSPISFNITFDD